VSTVYNYLIVNMRAGAVTCRTHAGDSVAPTYTLPHSDQVSRIVRIHSPDAQTMVNYYLVAITAAPTSKRYSSTSGSPDRGTARCRNIHATVHRTPAPAKSGGKSSVYRAQSRIIAYIWVNPSDLLLQSIVEFLFSLYGKLQKGNVIEKFCCYFLFLFI
jgi:hypothetical protein